MANPFTSLTAGPTLSSSQQQALVANPELTGLERQRKMAELLLAQGLKGQPEGQMISGYYVPPAMTQRLAPVLNRLMGEQGLKDVDEKTMRLAEQLRRQEIEDVNKFYEYQYGRPAQTVPQGDTLAGEMISSAVERNPQMAYQIAAQSQSPILRQQLAEMMKGQKLAEGETISRYNPVTGQMETVAAGTPKIKPPIQIDTGTTIELRDPSNPTKVLQVIPKAQMPTAGQVVEREEGTYLVDTRTGQAKPVVGPQGQALVGGKPLTETQSNAVAFGMRAVEANKLATDLESRGFTNTGVIRTAVGGTMGQAPIVGEKLEQGVRSTFNVLPQALGGPSPEQQQVDQARRNFITAVLRKESGAVISPKEYSDEERKYFPQLGDSDKVIKQKQDARKLAIQALEAQAGPSGKRLIDKNVGQSGQVVDFNQLPSGR